MLANRLTLVGRHLNARSAWRLYTQLRRCLAAAPVDTQVECSVEKAYLLAELIRVYDLRVTVDVGIGRCRSVLCQALAHRMFTKGVVFADQATMYDRLALPNSGESGYKAAPVNSTRLDEIERLAWLEYGRTVERFSRQWGLHEQLSVVSCQLSVAPDMVHIDDSLNENQLAEAFDRYIRPLKTGGLLVVERGAGAHLAPMLHRSGFAWSEVARRQYGDNDFSVLVRNCPAAQAALRRYVLTAIEATPRRLLRTARKMARIVRRTATDERQPWTVLPASPRLRVSASVSQSGAPPDGNADLAMIDASFPQSWSGFRLAEFHTYLERFANSKLYTMAQSAGPAGEPWLPPADYSERYPQFISRIHGLDRVRPPAAQLFYTVFLENAFEIVELAESQRAGLVFTLYPGGGFRLFSRRSDDMLRRVCMSPSLRTVIVTQQLSRDYLLSHKLCPADKIEMIYGAVVDAPRFEAVAPNRQCQSKEKGALDVCFVAHKYMPGGRDKGFDLFIEIARRLSREMPAIRFHVVGGFEAADADLGELETRVEFHGPREQEFFPEFYGRMDAIVAPNRPFVLAPGAFDGFPTGAAMEAGLAGVAVFAADPLQQNVALVGGSEIVIIPSEPEPASEEILGWLENLERLDSLSRTGQRAFARVLGLERQMGARLAVLARWLCQPAAASQSNSQAIV